jgi:transcriptional regulator with XRE-family HTH domain
VKLRRNGENGNRGKRERLKRRMTLAGLSERLGVPARTLYRWRRSFPNQVPKDFELESWREFIGKVRNYSADRTRPRDRNGSEPSAEEQNGEYSAAVERRERVLKLRLINAAKRAVLERRIRSTVTMAECEAVMERIRAVVGADLLRVPASLCHELAGRNPQHIQHVLDAALRSALERLSRPETYLGAFGLIGRR